MDRKSYLIILSLFFVLIIQPLASAQVIFTVSDKNPFLYPIADLGSTSYNNNLYIGGGFGNNSSDIKNGFWRYNQATDSWIQLANKTTPTWASAATGILDRIYFFSGFITSATTTNISEYYNITTNTWTTISPTPFLETGGGDCAATYGTDWIFLLRQNEIYKYTVSADTYTEMAPLSAPNDMGTFMNCGIVGDFFYAMGGSTLTTNVNRYSIAFNSWIQPYDSVPYVQYGGLHNTVRNGIIYYGYGFDNTNFFAKMYSYEPISKVFTRLVDGNHIRDGVGSGWINNSIYVVGGRYKVPAFGLDYVEEFDLNTIATISTTISPVSILLLLTACALFIVGLKWPILWILSVIAGVTSAAFIYTDLQNTILSAIIAGAFILVVVLGYGRLLLGEWD